MNINDLIERVAQYDNSLAKDLSEYVRGREYGLVFEASKPEFVRMWNKPVVRGDLVNVLPPRGEMEDTNSEDDPSDITYRYISKNGNKAKLRDIKTQEECEADIEDLVAIARFDQPIYCGLKEKDRIERGESDDPYQVVINGENYHALQTLTYAYAGKVDCIYIDPPYNSGATDWKYNNNYVSKDDVYRHSKWLTFMEDRLKVAKQLLNPKGSVLIVTIDEKEYLRLGLLLEQVFPEAQQQMVSITISPSGAKRDNLFSRSDEYAYILLFGNAKVIHPSGDGNEREIRWFYLRRTDYASRRGTIKGGTSQFYPIYVDDTTKHIVKIGEPLSPKQDRHDVHQIPGATAVFPVREDGVEMNWGVTGDTLQDLLDKGFIQVSDGYPLQPYIFKYVSTKYQKKFKEGRWKIIGEREDGSKIIVETGGKITRATTVWQKKVYDAGAYGTSLLKSIIGDGKFNFPKSLYAVIDSLNFFVSGKPDALIVDFFAGSGTTLHAVNIINSLDGGHRRCICVTNNEVSEEEQESFAKKRLRQGDEDWEKYGIANYVTWPRTKYSIDGIDINGNSLEGDYGLPAKDIDLGYELPKASGFKANAIYYELTYLEPSIVSANLAFDEIAPILWLRSGCKGPVLKSKEGYAIGETYAVLFDYSFVNQFIDEVRGNEAIEHIFIVTDTKTRYRAMCTEFPERDVVQLYESYLRSFEINTEV